MHTRPNPVPPKRATAQNVAQASTPPPSGPPDFLLKYGASPKLGESAAQDVLLEEPVWGSEVDACERVRQLIELGQTTPARVRIYGNMQADVSTAVHFPPSAPRS